MSYIKSQQKKYISCKWTKVKNLQVKRRTTTKQQGSLNSSPPQLDPPQDDEWRPLRIFLAQSDRHLHHPEGRDWCHQQRARQFLRRERERERERERLPSNFLMAKYEWGRETRSMMRKDTMKFIFCTMRKENIHVWSRGMDYSTDFGI